MALTKILLACSLAAALAVSSEELRSDAHEVNGKMQMSVTAQSARRLQIPGLPSIFTSPSTDKSTGFGKDPKAQQALKEAIADMSGTKAENVKLHSTESPFSTERRLSYKNTFVDTAYSVLCKDPGAAEAAASKLSKQSPTDVTKLVQSKLQANGATAGRRLPHVIGSAQARYNVSVIEHQVAQKVEGNVQLRVSQKGGRRLTSTTSSSFALDDNCFKSVKEAIANAAQKDPGSVSTRMLGFNKSGRRLAATNSTLDVNYWIDTWTQDEAQNTGQYLKSTSPGQMTEQIQARLLANGVTQYDVLATEHTVAGQSGFQWSFVLIPVLAVAICAGMYACTVQARKKKAFQKVCEDDSSSSDRG